MAGKAMPGGGKELLNMQQPEGAHDPFLLGMKIFLCSSGEVE